jgi:uncharacterized lipoprotein YajG
MIKSILFALAATFMLAACGDDASKKGATPPPADKKK